MYLKEVGNPHLRFNSTEFSAKNVKQLYNSLTSKMIRLKQKSLGMKPKSSIVNIKQRVNDLREVCVRQCIDVRKEVTKFFSAMETLKSSHCNYNHVSIY